MAIPTFKIISLCASKQEYFGFMYQIKGLQAAQEIRIRMTGLVSVFVCSITVTKDTASVKG